jgi:hypothetical protein
MTDPATTADDLDLLDDETRHAYCTSCYPDLRPGVPFTARCGRRAVTFVGISPTPPANACPDCLAVADQPCDGGDPR